MTTAGQDLVLSEVESVSRQIREVVHAATPEQLRADSPLPGWSRAHVVAHICGFSHAMARQWEYALRGELIAQYDGGSEGRNADIEALAAKPADELKSATDDALDHLAAALGAMSEEDWDLPISYRQGTAFGGLEAAWREYVIHLTDLDLGQSTSGWSREFCLHLFEFLAARIPAGMTLILSGDEDRTVGAGETEVRAAGTIQDLAAWLAGREPVGPIEFSTGAAPELLPWPARKN